MKSTFFNKLIAAQVLSLGLVLSHVACSKSAFQEVSYSSSNSDHSIASVSQPSTAGRGPASIPSNEIDDLTKPVVEGLATGVRSEGAEQQWENWALFGTTVQIQYSISENDAYETAFQIFPRDSEGQIDSAETGHLSLAVGSDDKPFAFAQYRNLEKSRGLHTFNLPLKYSHSNGSRQFLKAGDYNLFITACKTTAVSSCHKSQAIAFSVKN